MVFHRQLMGNFVLFQPNMCNSLYVIRGDYHQGSILFAQNSRGKQCTPNAYIAILTASAIDPTSWTYHHLNLILQMGDQLYSKVQHTHQYVEHAELPTTMALRFWDETTYSKSVAKTIICGYLAAWESSDNLYSLKMLLACLWYQVMMHLLWHVIMRYRYSLTTTSIFCLIHILGMTLVSRHWQHCSAAGIYRQRGHCTTHTQVV